MAMPLLLPETPEELAEMVRAAVDKGVKLRIQGNDTKAGLGRPVRAEQALGTARLSGILLYEPEELVISARAGTGRAEIEAALADSNQHLAFEPPDLRDLLGAGDGAETIGGIIAANLSGPRRFHSGAARDHFLGFHAVNGLGEAFKSGGRVVKNVTGFDLTKLMAGSHGTLAVLSDITMKVLPRPEDTATLLVDGLDATAAVAFMAKALGLPLEVTGAVWLPAGLTVDPGDSVTALRLEGPAESVADRLAALDALTQVLTQDCQHLGRDHSLEFWQAIRDVKPLAEPRDRAIWRVSVAPTDGPKLLAMVSEAQAYLDWAGGLAWLAVPSADDAGAARIRAATRALGGHATLVRADAALRSSIPVFEPQAPSLAALSRRVKDSFDPHYILNPGRLYAAA